MADLRFLYTCMTPGCEVVGHFTDEPGHCSICLRDLVCVADTTGELGAIESLFISSKGDS